MCPIIVRCRNDTDRQLARQQCPINKLRNLEALCPAAFPKDQKPTIVLDVKASGSQVIRASGAPFNSGK